MDDPADRSGRELCPAQAIDWLRLRKLGTAPPF
jgi:hypothetical protein